MSSKLTSARQQLSQIGVFLRQGKLLPAVQALHSAISLTAGGPLMRNEREEMEQGFLNAVKRLNEDASLRKLYPLYIEYAPGAEKQCGAQLTELLAILQDAVMDEAETVAAALSAKKATDLTEGQKKLDAGQHASALAVFSKLSKEYGTDDDLQADIGQRVMKAGLYDEAAAYLTKAVTLDPHALQHYNHLGMALRKVGRFDAAEGYYLQALNIAPDDAYLHFNLGRVYLEWNKLEKAVEHAEKSIALQPGFVEGRKLADFARNRAKT